MKFAREREEKEGRSVKTTSTSSTSSSSFSLSISSSNRSTRKGRKHTQPVSTLNRPTVLCQHTISHQKNEGMKVGFFYDGLGGNSIWSLAKYREVNLLRREIGEWLWYFPSEEVFFILGAASSIECGAYIKAKNGK